MKSKFLELYEEWLKAEEEEGNENKGKTKEENKKNEEIKLKKEKLEEVRKNISSEKAKKLGEELNSLILNCHIEEEKNILPEAKELINAGADLNVFDSFGKTPLINAVRLNFKEVAKELIESGCLLDFPDNTYKKNSALHWAVEKNNEEILIELLKEGADINFKNRYGKTPLKIAIYKNEDKIFDILIKNNADLNIRDTLGCTLLMRASDDGLTKIVEKLINAGADVNIQNENGETALMYASCRGHTAIVKELINAGADVNIQDNVGKTALDFTTNGEIKKLLENANKKEDFDEFDFECKF